jgi:hypothetical protein
MCVYNVWALIKVFVFLGNWKTAKELPCIIFWLIVAEINYSFSLSCLVACYKYNKLSQALRHHIICIINSDRKTY